ncbi:MAG: PhzF family phenazine biosynthesis isomerase [Gammaproteobacteria bacterium]|nr:MAG: PhzF family phenazine biosynthesis isomerase [Gammaproteobacteria bacterium]
MSRDQTIPYFVVDAFTNKPFSGNPAAVVILEEPKTDEWLQQVAAEFNLAETAFLWHQENNQWQLRWFTPKCEVNLCGHATLASAHVLSRELGFAQDEFLFSTLSGVLSARINAASITLSFPKVEPKLFNRIYLHRDDVGIKQLNLEFVACYQAGEDIIIEVSSEDEVLNHNPEIEKLARIDARGIILTAPSKNSDRDFVSRFFAPRAGVNEDPVTGSAHCSLAVLWSQKLDKNFLRAEQISQRGGFLKLEVHQENVKITGESVIFSRGDITFKQTSTSLT